MNDSSLLPAFPPLEWIHKIKARPEFVEAFLKAAGEAKASHEAHTQRKADYESSMSDED